MKTSLDYWIEIDRQKERALKMIEKEKNRTLKRKGGKKRCQARLKGEEKPPKQT